MICVLILIPKFADTPAEDSGKKNNLIRSFCTRWTLGAGFLSCSLLISALCVEVSWQMK